MKTERHSIKEVLAKNVTSFFTPPFQRVFALGAKDLCHWPIKQPTLKKD
jgi:hypothetical protein